MCFYTLSAEARTLRTNGQKAKVTNTGKKDVHQGGDQEPVGHNIRAHLWRNIQWNNHQSGLLGGVTKDRDHSNSSFIIHTPPIGCCEWVY